MLPFIGLFSPELHDKILEKETWDLFSCKARRSGQSMLDAMVSYSVLADPNVLFQDNVNLIE